MGIEKFISKICVQTAVYWGNPAPDGTGGMTYDDPVEIACRWDDVTKVITHQLLSVGAADLIISRAEVLVTQDLDVEGYLYLGALDDLDSGEEADPRTVPNAHKILRFEKTPMIKSTTQFVRSAYV